MTRYNFIVSIVYSILDINECDTNNGGCNDICINTQGSYHCICSDGHLRDGVTNKCFGKLILAGK